ncbi:MAG: cytochrome P460 family protein [Hoeflea sp.]|uniref:cytochrome P460 family protein n=1 Tax=Hoeflea sp. TaxID=1940281 RepID=UPI003EF9E278
MYNKSIMMLAAAAVIGAVSVASAQDAPFGNAEDTDYANKLWDVMVEQNLVGENSIKVRPFEGNEPHGAIQEVLATAATLDGHSGRLLVKRNHGGKEDLSVEEVYDDPIGNLVAITVMFKRESGYDTENQDWFWAKYLPSGELDKNPKGMQLAGRVAKGADEGCIACHTAAGGEDLETLTSK